MFIITNSRGDNSRKTGQASTKKQIDNEKLDKHKIIHKIRHSFQINNVLHKIRHSFQINNVLQDQKLFSSITYLLQLV